jgi:tryptophan 2,3-dioxygenase
MSRPPVNYGDYLQLDKILDAQLPESDKENLEAHDEMLIHHYSSSLRSLV